MSVIHIIFNIVLALSIILIVAQVMGYLARFIGQPKVVGEMIAGVLLGPSLFGWFLPDLQQSIFPKDFLPGLYFGAQVGVGLYMFLVGLEFNVATIKDHLRSALSVSLAGMVVPFIVAALLCIGLREVPGLFAENISYLNATLFMGAAIAITAFPMLARIIYEQNLSGTPLGTLALAAGAIDDVTAWCVLAIVLATFGDAGTLLILKAFVGGGLYAWLMLTKVRSWLQPLADRIAKTQHMTFMQLMFILLIFGISAYLMDFVGLHAVFGGFLLGIAMPRGEIVKQLRAKLEKFTVYFLLPLFFTYSGLNTQLSVLGSVDLLGIALLILVASILAKGVACWAAARLNGTDNRTAMAIGALMNARGLMELIIINIALRHGIIQPALFSIMVVMAILTTLMATPIFRWVYPRYSSSRLAEAIDEI